MGVLGNIPLPAALAWGAMQAPKVGEDVVSLIKSIQGARGEINAAEDYNRLMQIADPRQLQTFQPQGGMDAQTLQKLYANRDARMQQLFANETAPIAAEGSKLLADPEFRGNAEALQEFQSRPEFWVSRQTATPATVDMGFDANGKPLVATRNSYSNASLPVNPNIPAVLQQFTTGAKSQEEQAALGRLAQLKDPSLKGLDPFTLGAITSDKTKVENVQKFSEIAGKEDVKASNAGYLSAVSQLYGTTKTPEELAAGLAQAGAQFPNASKEVMESVQNAIKLKYPELKFDKIFTGRGEEQQGIAFNPLTGGYKPVGGAGIPSAPKTTIVNKTDNAGLDKFVTSLGDKNAEANTAQGAIIKIQQMKDLIKKGAGGAKGNALATVAPIAQMLGIDTQGMGEAQLYEALATTLGGSMRVDVLGPGPASTPETMLLKKVSGGGNMAPAAALQLLDIYEKAAERRIKRYNNDLEAIAKIAPKTSGVYPRVDIPISPEQAKAELLRRQQGRK